MSSFHIRPAHRNDAPSLTTLSAELGYPSTVEAVAARLEPLLASPSDAVLVAEAPGGRVVGWIHMATAQRVESDPTAELAGLVVTEELRGSGIGSLLVEAAETWARERGFARVRVRSNEVRVDTHLFYERRGYRRSKTQHVFDKWLTQG